MTTLNYILISFIRLTARFFKEMSGENVHSILQILPSSPSRKAKNLFSTSLSTEILPTRLASVALHVLLSVLLLSSPCPGFPTAQARQAHLVSG